MGVAEITPGISGATIAGLFNVYKGFISFLNSVNPIKLNSGIKLFFKEIDINFIEPGTPIVIESPKAHLNAQVHQLPWFPAEKITNLD